MNKCTKEEGKRLVWNKGLRKHVDPVSLSPKGEMKHYAFPSEALEMLCAQKKDATLAVLLNIARLWFASFQETPSGWRVQKFADFVSPKIRSCELWPRWKRRALYRWSNNYESHPLLPSTGNPSKNKFNVSTSHNSSVAEHAEGQGQIPAETTTQMNRVLSHLNESDRSVALLDYERDTYLIVPQLCGELTESEYYVATIHVAINRQKVVFLWPVKLPGADGRQMDWHISAAEAAEKARDRWVRVTANMSLGAYEVFEAVADYGDPEWPAQSFWDLIKIAFKNRLIDNADHLIIQKLQLAGGVDGRSAHSCRFGTHPLSRALVEGVTGGRLVATQWY